MENQAQVISYIEDVIKSYLPKPEGLQKTVYEAMIDAVCAGGKRIRPLLILETCNMFANREGFDKEVYTSLVEPFMAAMEMIHTFSLIHDDLPCMDNDTLRRGHPTTWVTYGEDMAVLAGDALLAEAMDVMANTVCTSMHPNRSARAARIITEKTGMKGMLGGQVVDVERTGKKLTKEELGYIYQLKTGALLQAAMMSGAVLGGASDEEVDMISQIALDVGIAFQIEDDILDETASSEQTGKSEHSDENNNKTTCVTLYGLKESRKEVESLTQEAIVLLDRLTVDSSMVKKILLRLVKRDR